MKKRCGFPYALALGLIAGLIGGLVFILDTLRRMSGKSVPVPQKSKAFQIPDSETEETQPEAPVEKDDLTRLFGIGEKTAQVLAGVGIVTYAQLAKVSGEDIKVLLVESGNRITNPATWPSQAALAAKGDWEGLQQLIESLNRP